MTESPSYAGQPTGRPLGAGLAITALILGILALITCWSVIGGILFGLIGLILGFIASGRAKRGVARGRGMAITGIILSLLGLLASIAIVAFAGVFFLNSGGKDYTDCVNNANGDQAKVQKCVDEFKRNVENNN